MNLNDKRLYFRCNCGSPEHNLVFTPDRDVDYPMVIADMQVVVGSLWSRVKTALSYVFSKHQKDYGHWHEVVLDRTDVVRLHAGLTSFLESTTSIPLSYTREAPLDPRHQAAPSDPRPTGIAMYGTGYPEGLIIPIDPSWWGRYGESVESRAQELRVLYGPDDGLSTFFNTDLNEEEE